MSRDIILRSPVAHPYSPHFYILLSAAITVFVGMLLLISSAFLLMGFSLEWYHIPLAAIPTMLFVWWGSGQCFPQAGRRMFVITSAWAVGAFIVFALLNGWIYDTTWDGQNYHYEAILQLSNGWNPFYENPTNAIYFQHLEQAKAFHMLFMLAAYLLCAAAFSTFRTLKRQWVVLLSILVVFNPVSLYQIFTFYVDGLMSSLLVIVISLFILIYRQPSRLLMITLASAIVIMVNIKLTGAIYAVILGGSYSVWFIWHKKRYRVELVTCLLVGYFAGILLVGYNPYITQYIGQFLSNGDPFYPSNLKTFIPLEDNVPSNFLGMGWGEKLLTSLFSKSQATKGPSQYKWPFTVAFDEILTFYTPDTRVAGFGPLFGGALLLTVVLLIIAFARYRRRLMLASSILLLLGAILASGLSNPEAWWARFVPQLWMLPLLTILLVMVTTPRGKLHRLSRIIVIILCINQLLIASPYLVSAIAHSILEKQQMSQLKNTGKPIFITFNNFVSIESRFKEWGIEYQSVDELPCDVSQWQLIIGTEARICSP